MALKQNPAFHTYRIRMLESIRTQLTCAFSESLPLPAPASLLSNLTANGGLVSCLLDDNGLSPGRLTLAVDVVVVPEKQIYWVVVI